MRVERQEKRGPTNRTPPPSQTFSCEGGKGARSKAGTTFHIAKLRHVDSVVSFLLIVHGSSRQKEPTSLELALRVDYIALRKDLALEEKRYKCGTAPQETAPQLEMLRPCPAYRTPERAGEGEAAEERWLVG